ncbi:MAG: beta strand repeat-containing protein [bacterium]
MSTIVTRAGKGSPLTNTEVDTNFTNLNTDKYQSGDSPTFVDIIADSIQFTGGTGDQGTISWNTDEETIDVIMDGSVLQVGQEVVYNVRNNSGSTIPDGTPVMATGTLGASGRITVSPMDGTDIDNSRLFIGITTEEIANDADGKVTFFGKVRGIDLSSYSDGDILWISTSTAGAFTATEPTSGTRIAFGFVISNASNGTMFVRADNGHALHESHDVTITTPSANDVLAYDGSKWVNVSSLTLSSLTVGGTAFTDKIELDDLSVTTGTPSGGGSLSYSSTTGVFTYVPADPTSGSVTSVAATVPTGFTVSGSPITTSGTIAIAFDTGYALPTIASQANWDTAYGWGDHASAGYLTSETYTGTVTSVAVSVPTGLAVSGSPVTSSGTIAISLDTGYSIPTTASQTNWDTAYGWGDHSGLYATAAQGSLADSAVQPGDNVSDLTNDAGYLTSETYTGTVTSVGGTGTVNGLTLTGTVTSSGNLTLGGTLSGIDLISQITGTLPVANGGTALTTIGSANQVLKVNSGATALEYGDMSGGLEYVVKTANYTAVDKQGVLADTSGGAFTVTLPATPATGVQVVVADSGSNWGTNNLTVGRNGSTIGGLAQDLVCDIAGASVQLVYNGSTWEVYAQIGGNGGTAVTLDGVQTLTNKTLTAPVITAGTGSLSGITLNDGYTEEVYALGTSGALTLEPDNGSIQTCALTGNPTFSDGLSAGQSIVLMLTNGASYTVTWPTMTWVTSAGNAAPTLTAADTLAFWKVGSTLYGAYVGSYV